MRSREEIEKLMTKVSGGLAQKERENAALELLLDIRELLLDQIHVHVDNTDQF